MTDSLTFSDSSRSSRETDFICAMENVKFVRRYFAPAEKIQTAVSRYEPVLVGSSRSITASPMSLSADDYTVFIQIEKNKGLIALLDAWIEEVPEEAAPDLDEQKRSLEEARYAARRLFTWQDH